MQSKYAKLGEIAVPRDTLLPGYSSRKSFGNVALNLALLETLENSKRATQGSLGRLLEV